MRVRAYGFLERIALLRDELYLVMRPQIWGTRLLWGSVRCGPPSLRAQKGNSIGNDGTNLGTPYPQSIEPSIKLYFWRKAMAALISAYESNGKLMRRCDAHCYNARFVHVDMCTCICGGANHGVGLEKAFFNTQALQGDWKETFRNTYKLPIRFDTVDQLPLFET